MLFDLLAPPVALVTPFVGAINHHDYGFLRPEVALCMTGLIMAGMIFGLGIAVGGRVVKSLLMALVLALYVDVQFHILLSTFTRFLVVFFAFCAVGWLLGAHLSRVVAAVFITILVTTLLLPTGKAVPLVTMSAKIAPRPSKLPVILHLVLDEHIGIEGIPKGVPGGGELKEALKTFFLGNGFLLFGKAYSEFFYTKNSLPHLVNLCDSFREHLVKAGSLDFDFQLTRNNYFRLMADEGYRLHVYQSNHMNFCPDQGPVVVKCYTYPANTIRSLRETPWPLWEKTRLIAGFYLNLSTLYVDSWKVYHRAYALSGAKDWYKRAWDWGRYSGTPVTSMAALDALEADLAKASPGDFFFAHVLLPHSPYVFDANCNLKPPSQWSGRKNIPTSTGTINDAETREARYEKYFDQMRCLYQHLEELFQVLRRSGKFDDAIIIVHGDHGSRIGLLDPRSSNQKRLSKSDYADSYSTLFAIKSPSIPPGYDLRLISIQWLFARLAAANFRSLPGEKDPTEPRWVYTVARGKRVVDRIPMIGFGQEAD